jgi:nicotinamidase-related amidase
MSELVRRMVELYRAEPERVAHICDELLDRSGTLLGYLRDELATKPEAPMNTEDAELVELIANRIAKRMQEARDQIGATEQQRIAFGYAEASMRSELTDALTASGITRVEEENVRLREELEKSTAAMERLIQATERMRAAQPRSKRSIP